METKACTKCGVEKPLEEFSRNHMAKGGRRSQCKACIRAADIAKKDLDREGANAIERARYQARKESNPRRLWAVNCLTNHRASGFDVHITKDELESLAKSTDKCAYCGVDLVYGAGIKNNPVSASLDRVHNDNYLTLENVTIVCYDCNRMKAEKSNEELEQKMIRMLELKGYKVSK